MSPDPLERALEVSACLSELRIRHVLIGGLAVGVHGHPRATRDVGFLVGDEAFESRTCLTCRPEFGELVEFAVTDLLGVLEALLSLEQELEWNEEPSVMTSAPLVVTPSSSKLRLILEGGPHRLEEVAHLRDHVGEGLGVEL